MSDRSEFRTPAAVRQACRSRRWTTQTSGLAPGFAQANLVILPREEAVEFHEFCRLNPRPCPLLSVTSPGAWEAVQLAVGSDLRTDLPGYRVWEQGELTAEPLDLLDWWRDDLVSFLIGCSFTFESALVDAGLSVRHLEQGCNVPMYVTNRACRPAGRFAGPLVVSMRPFAPDEAQQAAAITARFPAVHGAPVQIGDAQSLGIQDLSRPDFGDAVTIREGEVPVFWACGVTPQAVVMSSRPSLVITHQPGGMFVTDVRDRDLAEHPC